MIQLTACSHQQPPLLSVAVQSENVHCQTRQLLRVTLLPVTVLSYKWMSSQFSLKKPFNGSLTKICQDATVPLLSFSLWHSSVILLHQHWRRLSDLCFFLSIQLGGSSAASSLLIPQVPLREKQGGGDRHTHLRFQLRLASRVCLHGWCKHIPALLSTP